MLNAIIMFHIFNMNIKGKKDHFLRSIFNKFPHVITLGNRITGPVHVGDPITLLIYMRSAWDGFDIVVNDCMAHNGANKKIQLIDHDG